VKRSIGAMPFLGKSPRPGGALGPLTVRHANVVVSAAPLIVVSNDGYGYRVEITLGTTRGKLVDTLEGHGLVSEEHATQALERTLAGWQLPEQGIEGWEPRRAWTARERSRALRRKLHGY
jgi:hypothetical protein